MGVFVRICVHVYTCAQHVLTNVAFQGLKDKSRVTLVPVSVEL